MDYITTMDNYRLGQLYMSLDLATRDLLDSIILYGTSKITTIKFFRQKFNLSLTLAKLLFEERQKFLVNKSNPFGW